MKFMFEINYEVLLKQIVPNCSLSTIGSKKFLSYLVHLNIPTLPGTPTRNFESNCHQVFLSQGDSSFEAWKNAYISFLYKIGIKEE